MTVLLLLMMMMIQTMFVLNHYVSARDDHVFAEADRFIPERWLRAESNSVDMDSDTAGTSTADSFTDDSRKRYAFSCLPFGYGNRSCLGQFIFQRVQTFILQ